MVETVWISTPDIGPQKLVLVKTDYHKHYIEWTVPGAVARGLGLLYCEDTSDEPQTQSLWPLRSRSWLDLDKQ